ncbi:terpenoid synthase [Aspergillus ellipticus CBS 707.79]|uniref:Terpenoid synthase n=1 Tax=Aspergillus ellipticus CBS 707.79 TaxID=1448320 RepID=A0A319DR33_9EURO|nr:terpenoid synthase [Aspergillus ellipticus CBS 707.79]
MFSNVTWTTIDPSVEPAHFSRFPVGIANNTEEVTAALNRAIEAAAVPGSREKKKALIRHADPGNEPFAICHCTGEPERLVVLSTIIELAWINDDVTEELTHTKAMVKHQILMEAMELDKLVSAPIGYFNQRELFFGLAVQKAVKMDPESGSKMISVLSNYLLTFDDSAEDFATMDEYNPYRVGNCGYWISSYFIRWGLGFDLTDSEYELIREFDFSMGIILGLTNDYFSWSIEKDQVTDRTRNAVRVLMKEHGVEDTAARSLLRGLIILEEEKAHRLKQKALNATPPPSSAVLRYIDAIELYVGGSCYWHATAPRA